MDVFISKKIDDSALRSHPWTNMVSDESSVYMDFKRQPKLIRSALEDLLPFNTWDFVEQFYSLIEWVNGSSSLLESNDCVFNAVEDNRDQQYLYAKKCSARLMILFRDIPENCQEKSINWLMNNIQSMASSMKPGFNTGAIGLSQSPTCYLALGDKPDSGGMGHQVTLNFFAYGNNEQDCYESMKDVLKIAQHALLRVNMRIKNGEVDALYR
ncbi:MULTISPECIES: hypothetical protein [unclassified Moritella]|uniref:hypothetical protein n=1 Tax=unclassified Moritella TaxID=2637987 RepID=UPI001BA96D18|nr:MULTISPECIES: hypothetical protein [unclassified Moritella]QUM86204.1 hypothetical protein HWV02_17660 [Moritella sp. 28]QUM90423.1 hypothetical protein HWV03_17275 [Moritella sp. 36]